MLALLTSPSSLLGGTMFTHTLQVRFRDLDALNHVNNSVYLTYLEETRIAFMNATRVGGLFSPEHGTILARCEIDYRHPARLGDVLRIEMSTGKIRNSSFVFAYRIIRESDQKLIAEACTVQVCYNYVLNKPVRVPDEWKVALSAHALREPAGLPVS
jgi:acyl-CoA thioester hydrolase